MCTQGYNIQINAPRILSCSGIKSGVYQLICIKIIQLLKYGSLSHLSLGLLSPTEMSTAFSWGPVCRDGI